MNLGAAVQQELHHLQVALHGRVMKRRRTPLVAHVHLGAAVQQELRYLQAAVIGRFIENAEPADVRVHLGAAVQEELRHLWLRTNGVNTNGAAKVMDFDRLCHFWEDKSRLTGVPKRSLCQKHEICSDPISADPICPFPTPAGGPAWLR